MVSLIYMRKLQKHRTNIIEKLFLIYKPFIYKFLHKNMDILYESEKLMCPDELYISLLIMEENSCTPQYASNVALSS